jgi:exodeoxyribonuclease VII small subunit
MSAKKDTAASTFEESLARLEKLVGEMEAGDLTLDQMIAHFEEGSSLVEQCGKKLNEVEQRIEKLVRKDGKIQHEPFEPADPE